MARPCAPLGGGVQGRAPAGGRGGLSSHLAPNPRLRSKEKTAMAHKSLGEFIEAADAMGEVRRVQGADLVRDVGCLTELAAERNGPLLLFEAFAGYAPDVRIAVNVYRGSLRRTALAFGLPVDAHPIEIVQLLRERRRRQQPVAPTYVPDGPVLEHQITGPDVDVQAFPAPVWHRDDGGHYIGTGDLVVIRDPET